MAFNPIRDLSKVDRDQSIKQLGGATQDEISVIANRLKTTTRLTSQLLEVIRRKNALFKTDLEQIKTLDRRIKRVIPIIPGMTGVAGARFGQSGGPGEGPSMPGIPPRLPKGPILPPAPPVPAPAPAPAPAPEPPPVVETPESPPVVEIPESPVPKRDDEPVQIPSFLDILKLIPFLFKDLIFETPGIAAAPPVTSPIKFDKNTFGSNLDIRQSLIEDVKKGFEKEILASSPSRLSKTTSLGDTVVMSRPVIGDPGYRTFGKVDPKFYFTRVLTAESTIAKAAAAQKTIDAFAPFFITQLLLDTAGSAVALRGSPARTKVKLPDRTRLSPGQKQLALEQAGVVTDVTKPTRPLTPSVGERGAFVSRAQARARALRLRERKALEGLRDVLSQKAIDDETSRSTDPNVLDFNKFRSREVFLKDLVALYSDPKFVTGVASEGTVGYLMGLNNPKIRAGFMQYLISANPAKGQEMNVKFIDKIFRATGLSGNPPSQIDNDTYRFILNFQKQNKIDPTPLFDQLRNNQLIDVVTQNQYRTRIREDASNSTRSIFGDLNNLTEPGIKIKKQTTGSTTPVGEQSFRGRPLSMDIASLNSQIDNTDVVIVLTGTTT